ncbi:hypothetical protein OUQ99_03940 [Streptomonospora nanhaiensis]|uniref:Uncharacterized protein n=1 Tax=Streptomonospora nanhaiensis TaxID=1323731 RepID=A0ABY6YPF3_9ACTN|nr:hypothetical protein [Streptomonospora nanhaiensis]WAE74282.1 hypothetical protein OUQ99_03940 [Streptomonospora nanhaiensis]
MPPAPDVPTSTTPLTTDEQVSMLTDGDDKISPATFPVPTASPGYIETLAAALRTAGQSVADTGNDIDSSWGALTSSYKAPEADELYTVLGPVARDGDDVLTGLNNAANALENFAEDLRGIKRRWNSLRTEAYAFRARIDAKGDDWRDAEGVAGFFGIGESPDVEENSRLISEGTGIIEDYEAAERDCANQINHYVPDRTGFEAMPSGGGELDPDVFYHGYEDSLSDLATEWDMGGATTDEHWWVDAGAAVWDFGVGAVEGTGAMLGMHSSEGWFQASWGDALWEYHEGNVQSVASLVGMYDGESDSWGWAGGDALGSAWKDLAHSVVPWEEWGERPGYVIGTAALNIVAMVGGAALTATGVGSVVGVPLMAWRGMAIVDGMGGRGGGSDSGSGTDVEVNLPAGIPNYGGVHSPIASLDASSFDRGDYSPAQWTELQTHLDRWASASDSGGESSETGGRPGAPGGSGRPAQPRNDRDGQDPARPVDPTAQQLADSEAFFDIVEQPELAEVDRAADRDNRQRIVEVARESQTDPNGPRGSEEGHWTAAELFDGPEGAGDRVPAGVGGRGDDTLTAGRDVPVSPPDRTVNLADSTGRGSDGDRVGERDTRTDPDARNLHGDGPENRHEVPNDRHGADMRDRTPDVRNSADGGDSAPTQDSENSSSGSQETQNSSEGSSTTPAEPLTARFSRARFIEDLGESGPGVNEGAKPVKPEGDLSDEPINASHELSPASNERFGDNQILSPDTKYDVYDKDGKHRGVYTTDTHGEIRKIEMQAPYETKAHPELGNPRPNTAYHITTKNTTFVFETNSRGRNLFFDGHFTEDRAERISKEDTAVRTAAERYYKAYNEILKEDFSQNPEKYPGSTQAPQFELTKWNGGHIVGVSEYGGIPERLNQVAMMEEVNKHQMNDWALNASYRNFETYMLSVLKGDFDYPRSKLEDPAWQAEVDYWEQCAKSGPQPPNIHVRVSQVYDPDLPHFEIKTKNGKVMEILDPPPSAILVEYSINGHRQRRRTYPNAPDLT